MTSSSSSSSSSSNRYSTFHDMIGAAISGTPSALGQHQHLMSIYSSSSSLSDTAVLERHHQFLRNDEDDAKSNNKDDWGLRMARKYYSKLFKE